MAKLKKVFLMCTACMLIAAIAVGGTMAYLQDSDSDVNVMTLGNVSIEQIEEQLKEDGTKEPFQQAKDLYPGTEISKIVTVENTGKSDAYFRTLIAFESIESDTFGISFPIGEFTYKWSWGAPEATIVLDGVTYEVYEAVYQNVLKPGETSPASLTKVELAATATNEDMALLGDTYDILVLSQAVQTNGFANAQIALDTAFGDVTDAKAAEWFGGIQHPVLVSTQDDMRNAMKTPGAKIVLAEDIVIDDDKGTGYALYAKYDCEIDLNGHSIEVNLPGKEFYGVIYALNGAKVDIVGDGNVEVNGGIGQWIWCTGASGATEVNIYGGNWTQNSADFATDYCEGLYANRAGTVNIYGGMFDWAEFSKYTVNESREGVVNVYGGTFVNFNPSVSHDSDGSYVADGYKVVSETQANGDVWYTVVAE